MEGVVVTVTVTAEGVVQQRVPKGDTFNQLPPELVETEVLY